MDHQRRLAEVLDAPYEVDREVDPADGMFHGNWDKYHRAGRTAVRAMRLALLQARVDSVQSMLDLPCGHGRILRHMVAAFPGAEAWACDILENGVAFCERQFGARGVVSCVDPAEIALPADRFDLIWVGSLLTHLAIPAWGAWIAAFERWLRPGGVVLFSVHGREAMRRLSTGENHYSLSADAAAQLVADTRAQGWGFQSYGRDPAYGNSLTDAGWVVGQLVQRNTLQLLSYAEVALNDHQDIVACRRFG